MARKSRKADAVQPKAAAVESKVWRAGLYVRLSVEFNDGRGDSLETQRQIMEAYLALCPDIEIVEVYTDNGVSGQIFDREGFQKMLADAEAGRIDCIVVKDLSRLGRSAIDTGYYIEKYFPLHHIRFIAVNDQYDSMVGENSNHITVPLKNLINEAYAADIGNKIRAQAHQAMRDGLFIGSRPPYGYKKDEADCHKLIVNEDTAPVVRQIFEWIADGVPLNVVVRLLNEKGVMTPGHYLASIGAITNEKLIGSGKWQTRTLRSILENEIYTGDLVQGRTVSFHRKQIPAKPENWIRVKGTHEAIVSRELFEKANRALKATAERYAAKSKTPYSENVLRGRIFCGCCGKPLHRQKCHGQYVYHCISNTRIAKGACEAGAFLYETELFETIIASIRQEAAVVLGNDLRLRQKDSAIAARKKAVEQQIIALQKEAESVRSYLAGLYENYISGVLSKSEYLEMKAGYENRTGEMVEQIRTLREKLETLERKRSDYASLASKLASVGKNTALTSALVNGVIEQITVNGADDISIRFSFRDAFAEVMEVLEDA